LVHETDAIEVLRLASTTDRPGTFNVAADGVLMLSQAIRRAGKLTIAIPTPAVSLVGRAVRRSGVVDFSPEQMQYLNYGRVVCNAKLKTEFGYTPAYTTEQAFDTLLTGRPVPQVLRSSWVDAAAAGLSRLLRLAPPAPVDSAPSRHPSEVRHG
jgi:UDP-glucose 4-epimerase